jgi:hypothetical protein
MIWVLTIIALVGGIAGIVTMFLTGVDLGYTIKIFKEVRHWHNLRH